MEMVSVGVPVISPVVASSDKVAGKSGEISKVPALTVKYGVTVEMAVLLSATNVGGNVSPFGSASGPATQTPATAIGPSQMPSPSVSGLSGFVPVSVPST